jgi:hypothetical protein
MAEQALPITVSMLAHRIRVASVSHLEIESQAFFFFFFPNMRSSYYYILCVVLVVAVYVASAPVPQPVVRANGVNLICM